MGGPRVPAAYGKVGTVKQHQVDEVEQARAEHHPLSSGAVKAAVIVARRWMWCVL